MNKLWLKITGIAVIFILATFFVTIFWPTEKQTQQGIQNNLEAQADAQHQEAEKLYQTALLHTPSRSPEPSFRIMVDSCQRILKDYPNSPQAEKAKKLLQQYNITEREMSRLYPSKPAVRKSRPLRRRPPRRDDEWHTATNNETNPSN